MVNLDDAVIARDKGCEIMVDPVKAMELKEGKEIKIEDILAVVGVFKDATKGEHSSEQKLKEAFGTSDVLEVAKQIILNGDVQLTTEQRKQIMKTKWKEVINMIARDALDPKTKAPHPPQRIENAMEQAGVHLDPGKRARDQIKDVVKKIQSILPISFEKKRIELVIPSVYTGRVYGILKNFNLSNESWLGNGNLKAVVELSASMEAELYEEVNKITHGDMESKVL